MEENYKTKLEYTIEEDQKIKPQYRWLPIFWVIIFLAVGLYILGIAGILPISEELQGSLLSLSEHINPILAVIIPYVGYQTISYLNNKYRLGLSEKQMLDLTEIGNNVVQETFQTFVDEIREKSSDGSLTSEEKKVAFHKAFNALKSSLFTKQNIEVFKRAGKSIIEAKVREYHLEEEYEFFKRIKNFIQDIVPDLIEINGKYHELCNLNNKLKENPTDTELRSKVKKLRAEITEDIYDEIINLKQYMPQQVRDIEDQIKDWINDIGSEVKEGLVKFFNYIRSLILKGRLYSTLLTYIYENNKNKLKGLNDSLKEYIETIEEDIFNEELNRLIKLVDYVFSTSKPSDSQINIKITALKNIENPLTDLNDFVSDLTNLYKCISNEVKKSVPSGPSDEEIIFLFRISLGIETPLKDFQEFLETSAKNINEIKVYVDKFDYMERIGIFMKKTIKSVIYNLILCRQSEKPNIVISGLTLENQ